VNRNYNNGARRERRIMKKLEKEGWFCIRSAGSHSPIDIIAMMPIAEHLKLLDKKAEKEKWGNEEWQRAQEQANKFNIMMSNEPSVVVGYNEQIKVIVRFIQSKKSGYLSPKERAEKEKLEQKLGINIEVM